MSYQKGYICHRITGCLMGGGNSVISERSHLWYEERKCVAQGGSCLQYDQKVV